MKRPGKMEQDIQEVLLDAQEIQDRVHELAQIIEKDYDGKDLLMVCVLNGAAVFYIDLLMAMDIPLEMNFIRVSSYGAGTESSGTVRILYDLEADVTGKHVLIVEDIIDSGRTLYYLLDMLRARKPKSLRLCTLLDKPDRRERDVKVDYTAFVVEDNFVVGCGMDYHQNYRNLPYIGQVEL